MALDTRKTFVFEILSYISTFASRRGIINSRAAFLLGTTQASANDEFWIANGTPLTLSNLNDGKPMSTFLALQTTDEGITVSVTRGGQTVILPLNQFMFLSTDATTIVLTNSVSSSSAKMVRCIRS